MNGLEMRSSAELNATPLSAEEEARARAYAASRPDGEPTLNRLITTLDAERRFKVELADAVDYLLPIAGAFKPTDPGIATRHRHQVKAFIELVKQARGT